MHEAALRFVRAVAAGLPTDVRVYEIGSRNINGSPRGVFPHARAYHGVDLAPGFDVDAVADAADYVPLFVPDVIVCCEVLEHAPDAERLCRRAHELLSPGGTFVATMAGPARAPHSACDGGALRPGEFYRNGDRSLVARWCAPFADLRIETSAGEDDLYVTATKGV